MNYNKMTTLDACIAYLKEVKSATRPHIAKATGKNLRRVNLIMNKHTPFIDECDEPHFKIVSGMSGKGSHSNPAVYELA